jgi:HEAT repeat protein
MAVLAAGCKQAQPTVVGGRPVPYWIEALHNPDPLVRKKAVAKLGNVGPADAAALPAIHGALKDPDPRVRCEAIVALLQFGEEAASATAILEDLERHDRSRRVRTAAGRALEKVRGAS